MADWNPYKIAFDRLAQMDDDRLREYIFSRLTGRVADPEYNWSRNQEPPENFLVWASSAGDKAFADRLAQCVGIMIRRHLRDFLDGTPGEEHITARLLYLGEQINAKSVGFVLQEVLVREAKLDVPSAQQLLAADTIPWGDTLLHQALGALTWLEGQMAPADRRARGPFWRPLVEGYHETSHHFPPSLRIVALRALVRIGWEAALRDSLSFVLDVFVADLQSGRARVSVAQELASLVYFLVEESRRQEGAKSLRARPAMLEDPTPLAEGFAAFAANTTLCGALEDALRILCRSVKVFDGNEGWRSAWEKEYLPQVMEAIALPTGLSIEKLVRMRRFAAQQPHEKIAPSLTRFTEFLGNLRTIMNSPSPGSCYGGALA